MASNRLGFKPFRNRLKKGEDVSIVVDSNILIANYDELHSCHEVVRTFLNEIESIANITYFTTVTTKAEFLDYQRKRSKRIFVLEILRTRQAGLRFVRLFLKQGLWGKRL
jgi:predicted nucleic acid-binding protein